MTLTPTVAEALRGVAGDLLAAAGAWQDNDQEQYDAHPIKGICMSLDELAFEILAFVESVD